MTDTNDNLTPRERLAKIVAEETSDGRRVVQFFIGVAEGRLDGFQAHHRMDAAKELAKIGLEEFEDYVKANSPSPRRRSPRAARPAADDSLSPETEAARAELGKYARELTNDGRTVVRLYSEIMDGFRNHEGFKSHHRIAAARELIRIGFGPVSAPRPEPAPVAEPQSPRDIPEPEPNPMREIFSPELMEVIEDDEPIECPCDDGEMPCPEKEGECPYYGIEIPKMTEEESRKVKEWALAGLRRRAAAMGLEDP